MTEQELKKDIQEWVDKRRPSSLDGAIYLHEDLYEDIYLYIKHLTEKRSKDKK